MIDDTACRWAAALDRGLVDHEDAELSRWLEQDRRHRGALLRALAAFTMLDRGRALSGADPEISGPDIAGEPAIGRRRWSRIGAGAMAASLALVGAAQFWPVGDRIDTRIGEIRRLPLADGSVAVVNSGTRLRVAFSPERRDVEVTRGEAWFEVAHNPARPFVVASGPVRVQAVGTAFDVRRQAEGSEIVVTKGVVKVWSVDSGRAPIHVAAGQRATVDAADHVAVNAVTPQASDQQLAWREGRIVLDDMTLGQAAVEFNRYNSDRLEVAPALADKRVVGWFRTYDVEGFANASAAMVGGRVDRRGGVTRIEP